MITQLQQTPAQLLSSSTPPNSGVWSKTQLGATDHPRTAPKHCQHKNPRHHIPRVLDACHQTPLNREHSSNMTSRCQKQFDMLQTTQRKHPCEWVWSTVQPIRRSGIQNGGSNWQVPKITGLHSSYVGQAMQTQPQSCFLLYVHHQHST